MSTRARCLAVLATVLLVGACSSSPASRAAGTTTTGRATPLTTIASCSAPTRFGAGGAANEIHGTSSSASLWGLALGPGHLPPRAGEELKIVWKMTGTGALRVAFTAPGGRRQPLVFGPEAHARSSYHRPGDEWGTGFRFGVAGCWHIRLSRDHTSGDVWLDVAATSPGPEPSSALAVHE